MGDKMEKINYTNLDELNNSTKSMMNLTQGTSLGNAQSIVRYAFPYILNRNFALEFMNIVKYLRIDDGEYLGSKLEN